MRQANLPRAGLLSGRLVQLLTAEIDSEAAVLLAAHSADGVKDVAASKTTCAYRRVLAQGAAIQTNNL